jgi:hypothetical protein
MPKRRGEMRDFVSGFTGGWKMMADAQHQRVIEDYYKSKINDGKPTDESLGLTGGGGFISKMLGGDNKGTHPLSERYLSASPDDKVRIRQEALADYYRGKGDVGNWAKATQDAILWDKMNKAQSKTPNTGSQKRAEGESQTKVAETKPAEKPVTGSSQTETQPTVQVAEVQPQQQPEESTLPSTGEGFGGTLFSATGGMVPTRYAVEGGPMEEDQSPLGALQQYNRAKETGAIPTTPMAAPPPAAPPTSVTPGSVDPLTRKEYPSTGEDSGFLSGIFNLSKLGVAIGLKNINDDLESNAALPATDPVRQAKLQAIKENVGRLSADEIKALDAKIDPKNELPPDAKTHARLAAALTHYRNDPEAGKTMLSRLIMTDKFESQTRGALALQALQNNDVNSAAKLIADAYNLNEYDGQKMTPIVNRDGSVTAQITKDGRVVDVLTANKPQMVRLAANVANGDEFLRRAAAVAQAYRDGVKENKGKGTGTGGNLTPKDLEILKKSGHTVTEEGDVVPLPPSAERQGEQTTPAATPPAAIPSGTFNRSGLPVFASGQNMEDYNTQPSGVPLARPGGGPEGQGTALPSFAVPSTTEGAIPTVTPANPPAAVPGGTASPEASAPTVTPAQTPAPASGQGGTPVAASAPAPQPATGAIPTTPNGLPPQVRPEAEGNGEYRGTFERTPFNKPEPKFTPSITNEQYASMSKAGRVAADRIIARERQLFTDAHKSWAEERKDFIKEQQERQKTELQYGRDLRMEQSRQTSAKTLEENRQRHDRDMEEARQRHALFVETLKSKKPTDFDMNDQDALSTFKGHVESVINEALANATDEKGKPVDPKTINPEKIYPAKQVNMMRDATIALHRYNGLPGDTAANVILSMTNPGMQGTINSGSVGVVPRQMPFEANYNGSTDSDKTLVGRAPNSAGLSQYTVEAIPQTPYDSPNNPRVFVRFKDNSGPLTGVILPKSAIDMIDTVRGQQLKRLAMEADKESVAKSTAAGTQRAIETEDRTIKEHFLRGNNARTAKPAYVPSIIPPMPPVD